MAFRHPVSQARTVGLATAVTTALATAVVLAVTATAATATATATRQVAYQGYQLSVPASWQIVDLATHPHTCVRGDQHVVYLGTPGRDQQCLAHSVGRSESIVVQPLDAAAVTGIRDLQVLDPHQAAPDRLTATVGHELHLAVPAAGVLVTATYDSGFDALTGVLRGARLGASARSSPVPQAAQATAAAIAATATNYTGDGFDTCNAPSSTVMAAWTSATAYRAIGIYFAGSHRACSSQPNLTPTWLTEQATRGWHFLPIYVGTQASGLGSTAASKGTAEADDAVNAAGALGIPPGSVLYNDMEAYSSTYSTNVLNYLNAWTAELHVKGYKSGVYSSLFSGVHDLNANYGPASPDVIWFASYTGVKSTNTSYIDPTHWANHQRAHQYSGNVNETHGGYTLNIDGDYMDVQVAGTGTQPPAPSWPLVAYGDTGGRVKTVQYLLNQQQNAGLTVDGIFGTGTLNAVEAFQSAHGLTVDGQIGSQTWQALVITVQQGSTGSAVKAVQSQLTAHGLTTTVDGVFGSVTDANVRTYQTGVGLAATGVVDTITWLYLVA
jgi:peptidoglycan hydrolase-like protein with peptidoglycan-binding domain